MDLRGAHIEELWITNKIDIISKKQQHKCNLINEFKPTMERSILRFQKMSCIRFCKAQN